MPLTLYFACAIRNSNVAQQVVNDMIVQSAADYGCTVLAPYAMGMQSLTDQEIYDRDIRMMESANAVIAECSAPSHGVGFELCYAKFVLSIPILVLYHKSVRLSAMIRPHNGAMICTYDKLAELHVFIERFLAQHKRLAAEAE